MNLFLKLLLSFVLFIVLAAALLWGSAKRAAVPGPEAPPLDTLSNAGLQNAIKAVAAQNKLVGMTGRVVVDGAVVAEAVKGWRTKAADAPLMRDDRFHVGSIGKSMSATVIATLVEDGTMGWNDTLGASLPDVPMHEDWHDTTLSQLLTHTASAPAIPISDMINSVSEPERLHEIRRRVAAKMLEDPPKTEPGKTFAYSNAGFMLASIMAEETTGESWETLVRTRLAEPLGLDTFGFGAPQGNAPWGHSMIFGFKMTHDPTEGADNPPFMAAAGTMHMTLDDLLRYGRAHLDAGRGNDTLLNAKTFERLHTPALNDYAYGWIVQTRDFGDGPEPMIWHNGSNTMWYALLVLLPERNAAIALATNDGSHLERTRASFDRLALEIAERVAQAAP
ncbi:serine hydrolase domain-containing protein [uncultured Algimonas sp.]|uniref:serine hydrolase domain-containing protein n=1 Tax=uncultured Algimonas sp. TaxID=1547920 RepID=UPI002637793A|nr:serine hydrolase domain-containing protein [uncultured Algimonas sp.]